MKRGEFLLYLAIAVAMVWGGYALLDPVKQGVNMPREGTAAILVFSGFFLAASLAAYTTYRFVAGGGGRIHHDLRVGAFVAPTTQCGVPAALPCGFGHWEDYPTFLRLRPERWRRIRSGLRIVHRSRPAWIYHDVAAR